MKHTNNFSKILAKALTAFFIAALMTALPAQADLTIDIKNGYNLVVDSNVTSTSTYAPDSAYIGAQICNTSTTQTLENVFVYVGDYIDGSSDTPGIYPVKDSDDGSRPLDWTSDHLNNTGEYSLTHEGGESGTADATRYVGTLEPGECRMQYWLITYPQCINVDRDSDGVYESQEPPCDGSITGGVGPEDDLSLDYDVWATTTTSGVGDTVETGDFTMRNEISAAANKIWPNTSSKVPDEYLGAIQDVVGWGTLGPDGQPLTDANPIYPGQRVITSQGIWYDLGNVGQGFDNDGDLVPDQNAWLQPVGDADAFDPACFRMVNTYGIVIVKLKSGGELLIPFQNELYFENLPDNTGVVGLVYYQFIGTDVGCSALMTPYQEAASGFDNEKFSGDFGLSLELKSGTLDNIPFSKTDGNLSVDPDVTSRLNYEASLTNDKAVNLGAPDLGVPLVFKDSIPPETTYVGGSASGTPLTVGDTGSYTEGATDADGNLDTCTINYRVTDSYYAILYSDDDGVTWSPTEPSTASTVTDIQWRLFTEIELDGSHDGVDCVAPDGAYDDGVLKTSLPPGKTVSIDFDVDLAANAGPVICNTIGLSFGGANSAVETTDCTLIEGNNTISGTIFEDDAGTTGIFGNGTQDGDEAGVGSGVEVSLYYDFNGDGQYDEGDIFYGEITTDVDGDYSFTGLPDGPYLVTMKKYDGPTSDGETNALNDLNTGWGNTTNDPNLPVDTDHGIVKMTEDSTTATLAVNLDLNGDSDPDTVTNADFGFAPPLKITKGVAGNPDSDDDGTADTVIDEGDLFDYTITLENRLPSVGVQGPTGCEYTVWATTGATGSNPKDFSNPGNTWDASGPNRTTASAVVEGGGLRWIYGSGFNLSQQNGSIEKVEALFFGYFNTELTDDFLDVTARIGGDETNTEISTAKIESYIGEPEDLDPNSAISWNISELKPGGTGSIADWLNVDGSWNDFSNLELEINPSKDQNADEKMFYIDAIGIRVTTDTDCAAGTSTTLSPVPLQDTYDTSRFEFVSADPPATSVDTINGVIEWDDVGPILPGSSKTVTVTLRAKNVSGSVTGTCSGTDDACNEVRTDYDDKNTYYADGRQANDDNDNVAVDLIGKGEIKGTIWNDASNDGWPDNDGEAGLPNVSVSLYACVQEDGGLETNFTNKTCEAETNGNSWQVVATTITDANGDYDFIGLDQGAYIVEVGDSDGALASGTGGNTAPYGGTQTAEADDDQSTTSGAADAPTQGTFNNTWGNRALDLQDLNPLNDTGSEEIITGVDFGYYIPDAVIYGNIWYDIDGDASQEGGETGLDGFTVTLYDDTLSTVVATTTTDANGNYSFSGLSADDYVVVVTPPALPNSAWVETVESTGGTGSLNNQIPLTVVDGDFSGSHNFGYTQEPVSDIGDTVYYDFDGDGVQDSTEEGIPDITVYLYSDEDRDGVIDEGVDSVIATDVTDANGEYLFEDLPFGSYIVKVDTQDADFPSNVTPTGDPDLNRGTIGDSVWFDTDDDGVFDATEEGIPGMTVLLYEDTNGNGSLDAGVDQVVAATTTDMNGEYLFTQLNAGDYFVDIDENTLPDAGLSLSTGSSDPSGSLISLSSGGSYLDADAGYNSSSGYAIGNRIYYDDNYNDTSDDGEAGIAGVDVTVMLQSCYPDCAQKYTATTDESGAWIITGLPAGDYRVEVDTADLTINYTVTRPDENNYQDITISNADVMTADFGYKYDSDSPNPDFTDTELDDPTGAITGDIFLDSDGDEALDPGEDLEGTTVNLFDASGNLVATTTTDGNGAYTFTGVPIGTYRVQAVDDIYGVRYSTIFLSPGEEFPDLDVIYNETQLTVIDDRASITVSGAHDNLMADFGYQRFYGSIGDTVYQDENENADQDLSETGISGVTVNLYIWEDTNGDGIIDSGEPFTFQKDTVTSTDDPATAADESGKYLFTNLPGLDEDQYYVVEVDDSTLPTVSVLIADPDSDGIPCTSLSSPDDEVCDHQSVVWGFQEGINYTGADFGYNVTAEGYGSIGDMLWIDSDGDGNKDAGEAGIDAITVFLDANGNGTLDTGEVWVETGPDGSYLFPNLGNGSYTVTVDTNDSDWPSGLPTTPVHQEDGGSDNSVVVTVDGGLVTAIGGSPCSDCNLNTDFGYRYTGANTLSGTIGIDDTSLNGYLGADDTTYSGVNSPLEASLAGVQVTFYLWNDDGDNEAWAGDGTLDSGDSFALLGSTSTDANGDYSYANLPDNVIVVFGVPVTSSLNLTTTNGNTSVEGATSHQLYEGTVLYEGNTVTTVVRQALTLSGTTQDLDYAFEGILPEGVYGFDFGDLPGLYNATLLSDGGAQHLVNSPDSGTTITSIYLGAGITIENDGQNSDTASADSNDDGVAAFVPTTDWDRGTDYTESIDVTASDDGWLVAWVDFNQDGDFADSGERIIEQAVSAGSQTISFNVNIPWTVTSGEQTFNTRFRIYPEPPSITSSTGPALDSTFNTLSGEVEDYQWTVGITYAAISSFNAYSDGGRVIVEWRTDAEEGTVGFYLMRKDEHGGPFIQLNNEILPSMIESGSGGIYYYQDDTAQPGENYTYRLVEVEFDGKTRKYGPYKVTVESAPDEYYADPDAGTAPYVKKGHEISESVKARNEAAKEARQAAKASKQNRSGKGLVKIYLDEKGVYYLSGEHMADLFNVPSGRMAALIKKAGLALTHLGEPVAYYPDKNNEGIYFYNPGISTLYTNTNVFWLSIDKGISMAETGEGKKSRPSGDETFPRTVHAEVNYLSASNIITDPEKDFWMWDYVFAGTALGTKSFNIHASNVARNSSEAVLTVRLQGYTDTPANPDHHAMISINGVNIGEDFWDGSESRTLVLPFNQAFLQEGGNTVQVTGLKDTGAVYSLFYINSFDLEYQSYYFADDDILLFNGGGNTAVEVSGFSGSDILVFDITDPYQPKRVEPDISKQSGTYAAAIKPEAPDAQYVAVTKTKIQSVNDRAWPDEASTLADEKNRTDYLVIAPEELIEGARMLAEYRESRGLDAMVVKLEDIMDEFNGGVYSPHAIHDFLLYAYYHWRRAPQYVALAGAGSADYKGYRGYEDNLLPVLMVGTPYGLYPSDNRFADVVGSDSAPDMAIGRIPVVSEDEFAAYIQKIQAYESTAGDGWARKILMLADNPDDAGNFPADSDALMSLLPPDYSIETIYLSEIDAGTARRAVMQSLNSGVGYVNYVGHGSPIQLAGESMLRSRDLGALANGDKLPVMSFLTCLAGRFDFVGGVSLSESLVLKENGGAVAVWTASGMSLNNEARYLGEEFFNQIFLYGERRLGISILNTLQAYRGTKIKPFMLDIYNLIGDPALLAK